MPVYGRVTEAIVAELAELVGRAAVVTDPERLAPYAHDETSEDKYTHLPEVVVKPENVQQVSLVLKLANRERLPVTPRGAGTGLSAGCVPMFGGIVLSLERLNRVLELDAQNLFMVVEPGVTTGEIQRRAKAANLLYAGDPCSAESSHIGGNVAENAGGNKAVKYGTTSRHVYGLEVVTPSGEVMTLGGKCVKDVTGYDLIHLIVGSEGTLGVVTKIWLRLVPLPKVRVDLLVPFRSVQAAIEVVPEMMNIEGVVPTSVEFMDGLSITAASRYLNQTLPQGDAGAYLIISFEGRSEADAEAESEAVGRLCQRRGALQVYVADNLATQERVWRARKCVAEALRLLSPVYCMEDITVPVSEIAAMVEDVERIAAAHEVRLACFGHAGDGNIHATLLKERMEDGAWERTKEEVLAELYSAAYRRGGNLTGEHGVGAKRLDYARRFMDPVALSTMQAIKRALDPNWILNPGKVVAPPSP
ncbi:MAG: FAD-binding oxidoreductase [Betaproteobacteria bacterium]